MDAEEVPLGNEVKLDDRLGAVSDTDVDKCNDGCPLNPIALLCGHLFREGTKPQRLPYNAYSGHLGRYRQSHFLVVN